MFILVCSILAVCVSTGNTLPVLPVPLDNPLSTYIEKRLPYKWSSYRKMRYSRQLAYRIIVESKRRNLDPIALTAMAQIESNYQYWVTRKGDGSHGVWQTMRYDTAPRKAWKLLLGCKPGPKVPAYMHKWRRNVPCEAQKVANYRRRLGNWNIPEIKDSSNVISTYIAAYEISLHVKSCKKKNHRKHLVGGYYCKRLSMRQREMLGRYAHYNSGPRKPRRIYLYSLCKLYHKIMHHVIREIKPTIMLDTSGVVGTL
jgi:hypothetical protein